MSPTARCCGSQGSCACVLEAGAHIEVTGNGSAQSPFTIVGDVALGVASTAAFDTGISGEGTQASPWILSVDYVVTSGLDNIPNVDAASPTNGQVLSWNSSLGRWVPVAPTTAAAGAVAHDTSLSGDGSTGTPLQVLENPDRYLATTPAGLGLNDAGLNLVVRRFPNATERSATTVSPTLNALSILDNALGRVDYWDGATWRPITNGVRLAVQTGQLMEVSGAYNAGPVTQFVKQVSAVADTSGLFQVITSAELSGYAGVLSVSVQPIGPTPFHVVVEPDVTGVRIVGRAYRVDTGAQYGGLTATATVTALLY